MKLVLRFVGIVLAIVGCVVLLAGRSVATDPIGVIVLLVMGGLPLALGVFLIYKSIQTSKGKVSSPAPAPAPAPAPTPTPAPAPAPAPTPAPAPAPAPAPTPTPAPAPAPTPAPAPNSEPVPESVTVPETAPAAEASDDPVNSEPDEKKKYKRCAFKVAGISRRQRAIEGNLLTENYEYSQSKKELVDSGMLDIRIYKYDPAVMDASLVFEPDNPKDPNAIKVMVKDIQIGYVPAEKTSAVKKLLNSKQIHSVDCEFYGGPFKTISEDYDDERDKEVYTVEKGSQYIGAEITIEYE